MTHVPILKYQVFCALDIFILLGKENVFLPVFTRRSNLGWHKDMTPANMVKVPGRMTVWRQADIMRWRRDVLSYIIMRANILSVQTWETAKPNIAKEQRYLTCSHDQQVTNPTDEDDTLGSDSLRYQPALFYGLIVRICIFHVHTCYTDTRTLLSNFAMSNLLLWGNTCKSTQEHIQRKQ